MPVANFRKITASRDRSRVSLTARGIRAVVSSARRAPDLRGRAVDRLGILVLRGGAEMRGGARKGFGRKPGSTKQTMTFKLEGAILERLRASVPRGAMTKFVELALQRALDDPPTFTSQSRASRQNRAESRYNHSRTPQNRPGITPGSMFNDINIQFDDTRAKKAIAARADGGPPGKDPFRGTCEKTLSL